MMAWEGKYYGDPFQGSLRVTQGDPLYPTILNMVVDDLIPKWLMLVKEEEAGPNGFGWSIQWLTAFFYIDNEILDSLHSDRLQAALDVLPGIFDRVGIRTNVTKTVGMVCKTCRMAGGPEWDK